MKKILLGFVLGIICFLVFADLFYIYNQLVRDKYMPGSWNDQQYSLYKKENPIKYKISSWLIQPSIGLNDPLTKRCTKDPRPYNGEMMTRREYFQCNIVQVFISDIIFGERNK